MNYFNIKARQFDISCNSNTRMSQNQSEFGNLTATWKLETAVQQPDCDDASGSCKLVGCESYPCPITSKSLADLDKDYSVSVANCEYYYDYVEASIECVSSTCRATSMRKLDPYTDGYTEDQDTFIRGVVMFNRMATMPTVDNAATTNKAVRGSTVMERWIVDTSNFIGGGAYDNVKLYELPADVFASRLTILWNSFFQATYGTRALAGNLDKATSMNVTGDSMGSTLSFNATESTFSQRRDVYRVNWRWFAVMLACSLVLLVAAYAGLVLKYLSLAPDIIGYASSLTMLNPYVPTPTGGTTLHGLERAALLHNLPIRIGDVCSSEPVGAIALAADDGRVVGLDRRRWYI
jgi:hypothetical protein